MGESLLSLMLCGAELDERSESQVRPQGENSRAAGPLCKTTLPGRAKKPFAGDDTSAGLLPMHLNVNKT